MALVPKFCTRSAFAALLLALVTTINVDALLGGTLAEHNEFRSLLLLKLKGSPEDPIAVQVPVCSGVLIADGDWFVTAGSCPLSTPIENTTIVYAGMHDCEYDEVEMQQAPLWHAVPIVDMPDAAVALHHLEPDHQFNISTNYVRPASLNPGLPLFTSGVLPGWGSTNMHNSQATPNRKLRKVHLLILPESECAKYAPPSLGPPESRFCAGNYTGGGAGGCGADLGSPLYCDNGGELVLCGILISTSCGKPRAVDVYAHMRFYANAITETIDSHRRDGTRKDLASRT